MAAFVGAAAPLAPAVPMIGPPFMGTHGLKLERYVTTSERMTMAARYGKAKYCASLGCSRRKPISVAALSSRNLFGASPALDQRDRGLSSSHLSATAASLLSEDYVNRPRTIWVHPRYRAMTTVVSRASTDKSYPLQYRSMEEKKPRWWWRTLACIPYLMPLHVMSLYAEGAHRFLPFLENFEILADPFFGTQLPAWCTIFYCLGVYFLVVRRKTWPHFFRFHVVLAMLLDNAVQIIGVVATWMPYWRKLDAPFWTVVACGLLFVMFKCIRDALRGTYPDIPFFSEAAFMHAHLP